jgi:hypothetical protein
MINFIDNIHLIIKRLKTKNKNCFSRLRINKGRIKLQATDQENLIQSVLRVKENLKQLLVNIKKLIIKSNKISNTIKSLICRHREY